MLDLGEVRRLVAEYVVDDISTVESLAFEKFVSKIPVRPSDKVKHPDDIAIMYVTNKFLADRSFKMRHYRWCDG